MATVAEGSTGAVVVVGGGLSGLASAARLAKRGHRVILLERSAQLGGAVHRIEQDGFGWDADPVAVTLPAVLRDLFRKSGRPLEHYLDLRMRAAARRHLFPDGSVVDLPTGTRGAQIHALDVGLGRGAGHAWSAFVDSQGAVWDVLRKEVLDRPDGSGRLADRGIARAVGANKTLARVVSTSLSDPRLGAMAVTHATEAGVDPRRAPGHLAVGPYVERTFGVWDVPGGPSALVDALVTRLDERKVDVRVDADVSEILVRGGAAIGVRLSDETTIDAGHVVAAVDPATVFTRLVDTSVAASARRVLSSAQPVVPPRVTHLGLTGPQPSVLLGPEPPQEIVLHGDPMLVLSPVLPSGPGWTLTVRAQGARTIDVLDQLAERGVDVRAQVVTRVDRSAEDVRRETGTASWGLAWDGVRTHARRADAVIAVARLIVVGAAGHPGLLLPGGQLATSVWSAAHLADLVQP